MLANSEFGSFDVMILWRLSVAQKHFIILSCPIYASYLIPTELQGASAKNVEFSITRQNKANRTCCLWNGISFVRGSWPQPMGGECHTKFFFSSGGDRGKFPFSKWTYILVRQVKRSETSTIHLTCWVSGFKQYSISNSPVGFRQLCGIVMQSFSK